MMLRKKLLVTTLMASLAFPLLPITAHMAPANPIVADLPGAWTAGQTPPNLASNKPVILFVHGLTSQAKVWYDNNDMYEYAYKNGYQTAFINMYDITGTPEDMWKDGELLAAKIKEISQKYGKKLVIVAHSKGGVDTQAAIVKYDAYPYVSRVITLSSPHNGSELADLAYSSWAGWLADLVGSQSPGTSSLQTSYMKYFRSEMAKDPDVNKVPFYTMSGNKWSGSSSASYTFGGAYLSIFGSNDGVVTTSSALLPGASLIQSGPWNHATVRTGSYTFDQFKSYIGTVGNTAASFAPAALSVHDNVYTDVYSDTTAENEAWSADLNNEMASNEWTTASEASPQSGHYYIRGGSYNGTTKEALTIEDHVQSVTLDWISDQPVDQLQLISPDGDVQQMNIITQQDDTIFKGAYHQVATLQHPSAGEWQVEAVSRQAGAYLMTAIYKTSDNLATLDASFSDQTLNMTVQTEGLLPDETQVSYTVDYYDAKGNRIANPAQAERSLTTNNLEEHVPVPRSGEPVNYVITTDVEGQTVTGTPYKRTLVKSVYVDRNGTTYTTAAND